MEKPRLQKIIISAFILIFLIVHLIIKPLDSVALGLIALVLLPWLASILESAELLGVKLQFIQQVEQEQQRQAKELEWIKTLISLVLSDYERMHLRSLSGELPFLADIKKNSTFEWELRHLTSLGLVGRHLGKGIGTLFSQEGRRDVKEHLFITTQGHQYLKIFDESQNAALRKTETSCQLH